MKYSIKKIHRIKIVCLLCSVLLLSYFIIVSPYRWALPFSAKNVNVYSKTYGPNKQVYYLKAEISKVEFQNYISKLCLHSWEEDRILKDNPQYASWQIGTTSPPWWDPEPSIEGTFGHAGTDLLLVKYDSGNIYLYYYVD